MSSRLRLDDVRRAWESSDPELGQLIIELASQPDEKPTKPPREGAPTFAGFLAELQSAAFARKPPEEQKHYRIDRFRAIESPTAEVPIPDRLRIHEVIAALWEDNGPFARSCLLEIIDRVPLRYGPWRALKRIFKEAEARDDTEVFGALAARVDEATQVQEIAERTIAYIRRRAWRYLRRTAQTRPACYADAAADVLSHYYDTTIWGRTWVANHIFYHETGAYNRSAFQFPKTPSDLSDHAFAELWRRSPRPLFGLLERARSDRVRQFAADRLKTDFRASLRDVEPGWVARLVGVGSRPVDDFVVWVLVNVPKFEQGAFRSLGLHEAVLRLFDSPSDPARAYAADYARTHARDLPVDELVRLADNNHTGVRRLAADLLQARDPRKEVGLEAWGRLLESRHGLELASAALHKHFGARELTPDWFRDRLFTKNPEAFAFVQKLLMQTHPAATLGAGYFVALIEAADTRKGFAPYAVESFAMAQLVRFDLNALDGDVLRRLLLRPATGGTTAAWVNEGRLKPQVFGLDFLKAVSFHPDWEADPWCVALRRDGLDWARELKFDEVLSEKVLGWLRDVRRFAPAELGFEWLLRLAARGEARYHNFAVDTMIKGFTPADFAAKESAPSPSAASAPIAVDLGGASFLFTGKMATMQRKDAEDKVRGAGGAVASSVTNKLHYLVIGDEGSSLYGHGKKGTKQLKGEELNAAGANIRIISETAFLKMLSGHAPQASGADSLAGAERLWEMAIAPGPADAPLGRFAIRYILRHHPDIALAETDRPVDPGAEIPAGFLNFDRVKPLFAETRKPLRDLALELARWELARWSPPADDLVLLAESPHLDVRQFVAQALLADDAPEHRRYRIDPESLTPAAVFRFCESADESNARPGHATDRPIGTVPPARGAVPPHRESRPPRPGFRRPDALVALPRSRDHRGLEALRAARHDGRRRREKNRAGPGRQPRPRPAGPARAVAREPARPLGLPPPHPLRDPAAAPREAVRGGDRIGRTAQALPGQQGEGRAGRNHAQPGARGRRLRPDRPAAPGRVHDLPGHERAGRMPGRHDPDPTHPRRAPPRGRGSQPVTAEKYLTYRGDIKAAVGAGRMLAFVTVHPEGQPTALYRLDADKLTLDADPLPKGARAISLVSEALFIAGGDGAIYRATIASGDPKPFAPALETPALGLAPLADGRLAALVPSRVVIVSIKDGKSIQSLDLPEPGTCLAADPTGRWLAVGTAKGTVLVFDCEDKPEFVMSDSERLHEGAVNAILFEPDELRFLSAGADHKLYSTHARGKLEREDKGRGNNHAEIVTALIWGPGDRLYSGSRDASIKSWPRAGAVKPATTKDGVGRVVALAMVHVHDRPRLVAACDDNTIRVFPVDAAGKIGDLSLRVYDAYERAKHELSQDDPTRREEALKALAGYADTRALDLIAQQAEADADHALRRLTAEILGVSPHARAATLLEKLLGHRDEAVRVSAFHGLRKHLGESDLRPIDLALKAEKPDVGRLAVQALEALAPRDDQALARLAGALDAKTAEVRLAAVVGLESAYDPRSAESNLDALASTHADVRRAALIRLYRRGLLGEPAVQAALRRRAEDADAEVRRTAFLLSLHTRDRLLQALLARSRVAAAAHRVGGGGWRWARVSRRRPRPPADRRSRSVEEEGQARQGDRDPRNRRALPRRQRLRAAASGDGRPGAGHELARGAGLGDPGRSSGVRPAPPAQPRGRQDGPRRGLPGAGRIGRPACHRAAPLDAPRRRGRGPRRRLHRDDAPLPRRPAGRRRVGPERLA